ncbi:serine acetyltransferase 1, chloroplastic-like protein [Tanacetum coccineum]
MARNCKKPLDYDWKYEELEKEIQKVFEFKRFLDRLNDDDAIAVPYEVAQATLGDTNDPFTSISMVSEVFALDIQSGARNGSGILLDHTIGVVIGEPAVIGNNVWILHNVTLGGTGKSSGDRHSKIGDGVLMDVGTCVLGNIWIGDGAKIGAGCRVGCVDRCAD